MTLIKHPIPIEPKFPDYKPPSFWKVFLTVGVLIAVAFYFLYLITK